MVVQETKPSALIWTLALPHCVNSTISVNNTRTTAAVSKYPRDPPLARGLSYMVVASFPGYLPVRFLDLLTAYFELCMLMRFKGHICGKDYGVGDGLEMGLELFWFLVHMAVRVWV